MCDRLRCHLWWRGTKNVVNSFCKSCLVCASRKGNHKTSWYLLMHIPVGGPFLRVMFDILQLPVMAHGIACFTSLNVLKSMPSRSLSRNNSILFVENIGCRYSIPEELLSNRGAAFLSIVIYGISQLIGVKKIKTSRYHSQTDGLFEIFSSTLIFVIAESCDVWEQPCVHTLCISGVSRGVYKRILVFPHLWVKFPDTYRDFPVSCL